MLQPLTVPASICPKAGFGSSSLSGILNARQGAKMAARGLNQAREVFQSPAPPVVNWLRARNN
jgi:hypothetical protein